MKTNYERTLTVSVLFWLAMTLVASITHLAMEQREPGASLMANCILETIYLALWASVMGYLFKDIAKVYTPASVQEADGMVILGITATLVFGICKGAEWLMVMRLAYQMRKLILFSGKEEKEKTDAP